MCKVQFDNSEKFAFVFLYTSLLSLLNCVVNDMRLKSRAGNVFECRIQNADKQLECHRKMADIN
jgi:hypothetical protein